MKIRVKIKNNVSSAKFFETYRASKVEFEYVFQKQKQNGIYSVYSLFLKLLFLFTLKRIFRKLKR